MRGTIFEKDDVDYIFKKFPLITNESYYSSDDILTIAQHKAINEAFKKITWDTLEVGVNKHDSDSNLHMVQLSKGMGTRIYFDVEKQSDGIHITNVDLRPNLGCTDRSIRGKEKYSGVSMKQIQKAFDMAGCYMGGTFREYKEDEDAVKDFFQKMSKAYISQLSKDKSTFVTKINNITYNVEEVINEVEAMTEVGVKLIKKYYHKK